MSEEENNQTCEECALNGLCFIFIGMRKIFEECTFIDLDEAIDETLEISKGDIIFSTMAKMCDAYIAEHNCEECEDKNECKNNDDVDNGLDTTI